MTESSFWTWPPATLFEQITLAREPGEQVNPLRRLAALSHERRFRGVMEVSEECCERWPSQKQRLASSMYHHQSDNRADSVTQEKGRLAPNTIGDETCRNRSNRRCDETNGQSEADEPHVEPLRKKGQIEQHIERSVDHVQSDDVQDVQIGISAKLASPSYVVLNERGRRVGICGRSVM